MVRFDIIGRAHTAEGQAMSRRPLVGFRQAGLGGALKDD
jgi:hypothetical protein